MKKVLLAVLCVFPLTFLSGCAVTTATYSTSSSVYTPAYYPGSPYYGTGNPYYGTGIHVGHWGNRGYWGNQYHWRGYRGYYRQGWYGRHW